MEILVSRCGQLELRQDTAPLLRQGHKRGLVRAKKHGTKSGSGAPLRRGFLLTSQGTSPTPVALQSSKAYRSRKSGRGAYRWGGCAMVLNAKEIERREVWATVKLAVRAYSENPSELNSAHVSKAILRLRTVRERAAAARISDLLDARKHQDKSRTSP